MVGDRGQGGDQNGDPGLAENDPAGLSGQGGLHRVFRRVRSALSLLPQRRAGGGGGPRRPGRRGTDRIFEKRQGLLDGVCVTGGEPLLRPELEGLLGRIKELGFPVKLDTNGSHPDRLRRLTEAGLLDYVAMDIKNSPERYGETAGRPGLDLAPFRESVSFLLSGAVDYEFRTTVVRELHDGDSFRAIGPWLSGARRYYLQSFVDRDTVLRAGLHPWDRESLEAFAGLVRPWVERVELRGV